MTSGGIISTYAGSGGVGYNGDGLVATQTNLDGPISVAIDPTGILYLADDVQYRVRKIEQGRWRVAKTVSASLT